MSLIRCRVCGQALRSPESVAGTTVPCAKCGNPIAVPATIETDPLVVLRQMVEAASQAPSAPPAKPPTPAPTPGTTAQPTAPPYTSTPGNGPPGRLPPPTFSDPLAALRQLVEAQPQSAAPTKPQTPAPAPETTAKPLEPTNPTTPENYPVPSSNLLVRFQRHLHWALVLALIPLVVSFLTDEPEKPIRTRLMEDLDATPDERKAILLRFEFIKSLDEVLSHLPGERLSGAYLARSSNTHWHMAAATAVVYLVFLMILAAGGVAKLWQVLAVSILSAILGGGLLLLVQWLASSNQGVYSSVRDIAVLDEMLGLIRFSYSGAFEPESSFFLSFLGFTLGVGLCEEIVKALPVFWSSSTARESSWREPFLWGLASGTGFGIAEGLLYSSEFYNGVAASHIYLIRFISCVAMQAIWTGSVALLVYRYRDSLQFDVFHASSMFEWILPVLYAVAVPVLLHGLFDTCVKKELHGLATLVAVVSFGYLGLLLRAPEPRTRPGIT